MIKLPPTSKCPPEEIGDTGILVVAPGSTIVGPPAAGGRTALSPGTIEAFIGYEKLPPRTKPEPPRRKQRKEPIENDFTMQYMLHPRYL